MLFHLLIFYFCDARIDGNKEVLFQKRFAALNVSKICDQKICYPRIIWNLWDSSGIPEDVQEMMKVTRDSLVNFTYCLLTLDGNLSDFLDVDTFSLPHNFQTFQVVWKSDILRVRLLEKYGGVYVDASTYIFSGVFMEWFIYEGVKSGKQVVGFSTEGMKLVSTCFFGAAENSVVLKLIRREHELALADSSGYVEKYCSMLRKKQIDVNSWYWKEYEILCLSIKIVMLTHDLYNKTVVILHTPSLVDDCHWDRECVQMAVRDPTISKKYTHVKMFSGVRNFPSKNKRDGDKVWESIR